METTDFLIIGSGPGGALTAWELKKNKKKVLLIESGSFHNLDSCKPYSTLEMEQKYKYGGLNPTFNNPKISYVEGNCAGGGSEINSGFYHRTPRDILNNWANTFKIEQFAHSDLESHFKIIEKEIFVSHLPKNVKAAKASLKLKEGADILGWKSMEVPRWYKFNEDGTGRKQSMTETYLKWFLEDGGRLISNLKAKKIKYKKNGWEVSCKKLDSNENLSITTKYLFLCGGAISTPFLLKASGISENIGKTLQMHPTVKAIAEYDEIINYKEMGVPVHQIKEFAPSISFGCSISSKPHLALAMLDNDKYINRINTNWEMMAIYYAMILPEGKGKVIKLPFSDDPLIKYNLSNNDLELLSDGLKKMCELLLHSGAKNIYPSIKNFGAIRTFKDINKIPAILSKNKTSLMTIHLFSSCPMGEDTNICPVNSFGQVFKHKNLFINDGSLLPTAPGVNPQGTIMAIARRNIHHFLKKFN